MIALLIIALVMLVCIVLALAAWGTTTAATGLTLGASNAALAASNAALAQANTTAQATIAFLICALVALLPLIIFGAMRLGMLICERPYHTPSDDAPIIQLAERTRPPMIDATPALLALPAPRDEPHAERFTPPRRLVRRTAPHKQRAVKIAKRWFV